MSDFGSPARVIQQYRVLTKIGEGGMGEVYLAQDTKLGRKVALKILPHEVISDPERLRRFEQEAKAASALNQPNIITIHEIGTYRDTHFIVTEYIDGETLRSKLSRERLQIEETLEYATQIASALEAAHRSGITHRDIKPENIMVRTDGLVKILDFGLAKLTEAAEVEPSEPDASTRIKTNPGIVLGTLTYMSPEQARGRETDGRSDIFSFGVVLHEMLVGRSPFARETTSDVIVAILTVEPASPGSFNTKVPAELDRIVSKTLRKEREERYQTATDLLRDLTQLKKRLQFDEQVEREFGVTRKLQSDQLQTQKVSSGAKVQSLAVLPFINASGDPQMEYLSDGLTESVLFGLSQLPDIQVLARSAVFRHKDSTEDSLTIGRTLGVGAIVTGGVRQRGHTLLITAELIDVASGWQLWGAQYKRPGDELSEIEDEIANEISSKLRLTLSPEKQLVINRRRTESPEAYHLYLKARFYWGKRTEESLYKALQLFREAIEADPLYALAYAGLAEGYVPLAIYCYLSPRESIPKAKAAAERAIEIESELAEALTVLGGAKAYYDWDMPGGEALLRKAVSVDPKYPRARQTLAECLIIRGRFDEAIAEIQKALDLDPLSLHTNAALVMDNYFARRYAEAIKYGHQCIELDSGFYPTRYHLGLAYQASGEIVEAIAQFQHAQTLSSGNTLMTAGLAAAFASAGKIEESNALLAELDEVGQKVGRKRYVSQTAMAAAYVCKGDIDEAFLRLERAYDDRCCWLGFALSSDARFDALRADPRFQTLVQRIGLRSN
jgi:eukaryotic-like serine/threonine-protein kinase